MIVIGEITKAQGVKGEIKVNPLTDDVARFKKLKKVYIAKKEYEVDYAKILCNGVFVKLFGIDDRNHAELLAGKKMEIEREDAVQLDDGEFFIVDVIGSNVTLDGERLGKLKDIMQYGAADVYVVKLDNGKEVLFPLLKRVVSKIDTQNKVIDLKKDVFEEIAVYED